MFFKIADFLIEIENVRDIPFFTSRFYIPYADRKPHIKIELVKDDFVFPANTKLIFKVPRKWEIYQSKRELIFVDRLNRKKINFCRSLVFDEEIKHGKLYVGRRKVPFSYLENPLVYPLGPVFLLYRLVQNQGLFIHAAAVQDERGNGYIFVGKTGSGKTTMAKIWLRYRKGIVLNDERAIIRWRGNKFYIYGCPWFTKNEIFISNRKAPITKIIFLKGVSKNYTNIKKMPSLEAFWRLIEELHIPWWEKSKVEPSIKFVEHLTQGVRCFEMLFTPSKVTIDLLLNM